MATVSRRHAPPNQRGGACLLETETEEHMSPRIYIQVYIYFSFDTFSLLCMYVNHFDEKKSINYLSKLVR